MAVISSHTVPVDPKSVQILGLSETKTSAVYVDGSRQDGQFKTDPASGKLLYRGSGIVQVNGVASEATIETLTKVPANSVPFGTVLVGSRGELRIRTAQNGFGLAISVFVENITPPAAR
ncbi:hypothetical protein [Frondihabitans peucedani]|uniref:Uncharacterized protein n=1 Tax=Frondihabitans peucedani TaxID=598626 RepID=A0ABP8E6E9_9MICO